MTTLPQLLDRGAPHADTRAFLDAATPDERLAALVALTPRQQQALYDGAAGADPLDLDAFVSPDGRPVPHAGVNTLPIPTFGRKFTKWMVRQPDGRVEGWNASPFAWLIGPGYFTLRRTVGDEQRHGGVVVDYYLTPQGPFPTDWPWVRPNWLGLQAFVYGWCHDYMRPVSRDVTIGAAFKWGRSVGSWFVLHRPDRPSQPAVSGPDSKSSGQ